MAFTAHTTVNTGDDWSAANHNTKIKGNWDYVEVAGAWIDLHPDEGFAGTTITAPTKTKVEASAGVKPSWFRLAYGPSVDANWWWTVPMRRDYIWEGATSTGKVQFDGWYYLSANPADATKDIEIQILYQGVEEGTNLGTKQIAFTENDLNANLPNANILTLFSALASHSLDPIVGGIVKNGVLFISLGRRGSYVLDDYAGTMYVVACRIDWPYD